MGIFIKKNLDLGPMNGITLIQLTLNFIGNMHKRINLPLFYAHIYHVAPAKSVMVLGVRTNYKDCSSIHVTNARLN
jgi:hypothetical protein